MRKVWLLALSGMLSASVALAGCAGSAPSTPQGESQEEVPVQEQDAPIVGGWRAYDGSTPAYTDEEKAVFDQAMASLLGVDYELVRVLGTQVVSGTNYAFLARGATVTADPVTSWYVAVVYRDLEGNASLTSVEAIDLAEPATIDEASAENVVGGWELRAPTNSLLEPQEAAEAFDKASAASSAHPLYPIATLGTQVVSGTNYLVLCAGMSSTQDPQTQLYLATVYADLEGGAQLTDVRGFDLLAYVG